MDDKDLLQLVTETHTDVKWLKRQLEAALVTDTTFEKRLRKQERKSSWMMGAGLIIAAICAKVGMPDLTAGLFH